MSTFSGHALSGSTDGTLIPVTATASPGTTLHTAHASALDEVHLWAVNQSTTDRKLTVEFGSTTSLVEYTVPYEDGLHAILPGLRLTSSKVVRAFAGASDAIWCGGHVNRIT